MRKFLLIGAALAALLVVVLVLRQPGPPVAPEVAPVLSIPRRTNSHVFVRPQPVAPAPDRLELKVELPEGLSEDSQLVMQDSLRTFAALEWERRNTSGNAARLLEALQRKLWLDDYTYAATLSEKDCSQAATRHSNLVAQVRAIGTAELKQLLYP